MEQDLLIPPVHSSSCCSIFSVQCNVLLTTVSVVSSFSLAVVFDRRCTAFYNLLVSSDFLS